MYTIAKQVCERRMVIDRYFQKSEHKCLSVLTQQRSESKIGIQNPKRVFKRKPPSESFSYNHPKFKVLLLNICYMIEIFMLHL